MNLGVRLPTIEELRTGNEKEAELAALKSTAQKCVLDNRAKELRDCKLRSIAFFPERFPCHPGI
jgi:hypothetical protein